MERRRLGIVGFGHLGEYLYRSITESPAVSAKIEVRGMRRRRRRPPALRARLHSSSPFDAARRLRCCQIVLVWNRTADKVRESGIVPTALVCDNVDDFERALRRGLDRGGRARRHVGQVRRALRCRRGLLRGVAHRVRECGRGGGAARSRGDAERLRRVHPRG